MQRVNSTFCKPRQKSYLPWIPLPLIVACCELLRVEILDWPLYCFPIPATTLRWVNLSLRRVVATANFVDKSHITPLFNFCIALFFIALFRIYMPPVPPSSFVYSKIGDQIPSISFRYSFFVHFIISTFVQVLAAIPRQKEQMQPHSPCVTRLMVTRVTVSFE